MHISQPASGMNRQWCLKAPIEPEQLVGAEHFELVETALPVPDKNQYLLQTLCLGTSPAQRAYVTDTISMHDKVAAGEVMRGRGVAVVKESKSDLFHPGELVMAATGWQDYSIHTDNEAGMLAPRKIAKDIYPCSLALGILGSAGITAYFGLTEVGAVNAGDTVLVSAAAGGVGSSAVQIAKALGARVIGIAGSSDKCQWLTRSYGIDDVIDYKHDDLEQSLSDLCPHGVDVYFDNVGGDQLDAVLNHLALGARIIICGFIATDYDEAAPGPRNYKNLLRKRARMQGYFVFDYHDQFPLAEEQLMAWYKAEKLIDNTDVLAGLENMPNALQSLFTGGNCGVRICQVAAYPELILS